MLLSSLTDSFHLSISSSSNFPLQYFECTFLKHASQYSHLPRFTRGATPRPVSWPRSKVSKLDTCVIGELSQIGMFGFFCCEAFLWNKVSLFHSQGVTSAHTFAFFVPDKFFVSGYFYLHSSKQHAQNIAPVWTGLNISFSVTLEHRLSIRGAPWRPPGPPGAPMTAGMSSWAIVSHPGSLWVIFDPSGVNNSSVYTTVPPYPPTPNSIHP